MNFNKVAATYLQHASVQESAAQAIIEKLSGYYDGSTILDLGSGPGTLEHSADAQAKYNTVLFDLSINMLKAANIGSKVSGDAAYLPFADQSFSLIISNLMIQWPQDKVRVLSEVYRVLKPNGVLIFTTLIPPSLYELQQAGFAIDNELPTLDFVTQDTYLRQVEQVGFCVELYDSWSNTSYFTDVLVLLRYFKNTGTNLACDSNQGLNGRNKIKQLSRSYNKYRTPDGLPLTYTYLLVVASKKGIL